VTALHVLQDDDGSSCASTVKQEGTGRTSHVTTYSASDAADLAVAHLSSPLSGFYFQLASSPPSKGARVIALGYSLGNPLSLNQGTVVSRDSISGLPYLFMNVLGGHGSSGGPILNSHGQAVGLTQIGKTDGSVSVVASIDLATVSKGGAGLCKGVATQSANTLCRTAPTPTPPAQTPSWPPPSYTRWSASIAYKWATAPCRTAHVCWHIDVLTNTGCADGVSITLYEYANGAVAGSATGRSPRVTPMTDTQVEIAANVASATSAALARITC
jgi:hypothetical protein